MSCGGPGAGLDAPRVSLQLRLSGVLSSSALTCVHIPDLDAAVVEAGGQQQLVLPELEAVPLDVDAAALLLRHRGAEGQAPHDVPAVDDVLAGLAPLAALAALPRQPRAGGAAAILGAVQQAAKTTQIQHSTGYLQKQTFLHGLVKSGSCHNVHLCKTVRFYSKIIKVAFSYN